MKELVVQGLSHEKAMERALHSLREEKRKL